MIRGFDKI